MAYLFALNEGVAGATQRLRWPALVVVFFAYASFILWRALRQDGATPSQALSLYASFAYAAFQWCSIVAILGFGRRWLNRDAPVRRYLTEAVFPFYSHQVFVGRAEIGAAWSRRSNEGRDYLSVKLDDPSFNAPIYANLFDDEDGDGYTLIWSRSRKPNGD